MRSIKCKLILLSHIGFLSMLPGLGKAQESVINKAIEVSGMEETRNAKATFTSRDKSYEYKRQDDQNYLHQDLK